MRTVACERAADRLAEARRRFEGWRRSRRGYGRIPDELWRMAAEVAKRHGAQATAAALKLDAARLKQRMRTVGREANGTPSSSFVELAPLPGGSTAECTLELEHPSGRKLRICLKGQATAQAWELGQLLWKDRS